MVSSDDNMKLEQRIKLLEESTRRISENFDILNESHRRLEFENLEVSNEFATQRQMVKQLTEEKQKIIEDAAIVERRLKLNGPLSPLDTLPQRDEGSTGKSSFADPSPLGV
ncbi:hypothetical protein ACFE04_001954 [Oxalis oulophora]